MFCISWHDISLILSLVIRISTLKKASCTVVVIDGRLTSADMEEVVRVRKSLTGSVLLELGGLDSCAEDGVRFLREWLHNGATLDHAAPFLRMVLEGVEWPPPLKQN